MKSSTTFASVELASKPICYVTSSVHSNLYGLRTIAPFVGSSQFAAIADDTLKDQDNAGWVLQLELSEQRAWVERIRWVRLVDRLAETELIDPTSSQFQSFYREWQTLLLTSEVEAGSAHTPLLAAIREHWWHSDGRPAQFDVIRAWQQYVSAIRRYHVPNLVIHTCEEYEQMLLDLAGSFFQTLPFLTDDQRSAACQFGVVDQFYNHLRDLQEDAVQGICYLPTELLNRFNVSRTDILHQQAPMQSNYHHMMQFWLNDYLPKLQQRVHSLKSKNDLHPSWRILIDWSIYRYRRIERIFRQCHFNYTQFPAVYWAQVKAELPIMLAETPKPVETRVNFATCIQQELEQFCRRSFSKGGAIAIL